jgi:hypothetical protein
MLAGAERSQFVGLRSLLRYSPACADTGPSSTHRYSNRGRFDFAAAECDMVDGHSGIPSFEGGLGSIRRWLRLRWAFLIVHFG